MKVKEVLIGQGEDYDIEWVNGFEIIDEIDQLLLDFATIGQTETEDATSPIYRLSQSSMAKNFDSDVTWENSVDLIASLHEVTINQTFHDPDMPISGFWKEFYINENDINQVHRQLEALHVEMVKISEELGISQRLKSILQAKAKTHLKNLIRPKKIEVSNTCYITHKAPDQTIKLIKSRMSSEHDDLHCEGNFLLHPSTQRVFVITAHSDYSTAQSKHDKLVCQQLNTMFELIEFTESAPEGSSWIPFFAGQRRELVMGWKQLTSVLHHENSEVLSEVNDLRKRYVKRQNETL
jgi:hypothetical protein